MTFAARPRRAGIACCCTCPKDPCGPTDARRRRYGAGGRWRFDRLRCKPSLARRRTSRRACRALRSLTLWRMRRALASSWGTLFDLEDLGRRDLRVFQGLRGLGLLKTLSSRKPLRGSSRRPSDGACRALVDPRETVGRETPIQRNRLMDPFQFALESEA